MRCLTTVAVAAAKPPEPTGTITASKNGVVSNISSAIEPYPASMCGWSRLYSRKILISCYATTVGRELFNLSIQLIERFCTYPLRNVSPLSFARARAYFCASIKLDPCTITFAPYKWHLCIFSIGMHMGSITMTGIFIFAAW